MYYYGNILLQAHENARLVRAPRSPHDQSILTELATKDQTSSSARTLPHPRYRGLAIVSTSSLTFSIRQTRSRRTTCSGEDDDVKNERRDHVSVTGRSQRTFGWGSSWTFGILKYYSMIHTVVLSTEGTRAGEFKPLRDPAENTYDIRNLGRLRTQKCQKKKAYSVWRASGEPLPTPDSTTRRVAC